MTTVQYITDPQAWDDCLARQVFRPFLQSWTMGEVARSLGQTPVRLGVHDDAGRLRSLCLATLIPARRGRHLAVAYGPVGDPLDIPVLLAELARIGRSEGCRFVRLSPHLPRTTNAPLTHLRRAPLHLLAEEIWYLPLRTTCRWTDAQTAASEARTSDELLAGMRKTTRNLVRRAERDGVTIEASTNPLRDLEDHFIRLHDETRKRHGFTPYSNRFFRTQVEHFAPRGEVTVYLAHHQGEVISASVHMHAFGETSYHHGASSAAHSKVPSSYLLQWRAITDALARGDDVYNFWGIAPTHQTPEGDRVLDQPKHPFAGVTTFKTGFGGSLLQLQHCLDLPLTRGYHLTRGIELVRKWRRGF
jgi:lipid II:glycine glycyltransferase (peptidoglycan interpeptide bridge formation enzyme)